MTDERCADLERLTDVNPFQVGRSNWLARLDGLVQVDDCIVAGLVRSSEAEDWSRFGRYVLALTRHPSKKGGDVLCEVLGRRINEVNNEDIVDALAEIRDPASVPWLADVMWWLPDWDEFHQLAIKSVWALAAIASPEAVRMLNEAASWAPREVREAASRELKALSWREQR